MLFCVSLTCSQLKEWIIESPIKKNRERERERERVSFWGRKVYLTLSITVYQFPILSFVTVRADEEKTTL